MQHRCADCEALKVETPRSGSLSSLAAGQGYYRLNRKNCFVPEIGLVTAFCPLTTTGPRELVVQTADEPSSVADCKVNPAALVGHVKMTLAFERIIANCGALTLTDPNERLNTVPLAVLLPAVVPYRVSPDKINPAYGSAPPLPPVKLCRFVNPVPLVLMANTVPLPELPPTLAVPYRVLLHKINPACGLAPSPFV